MPAVHTQAHSSHVCPAANIFTFTLTPHSTFQTSNYTKQDVSTNPWIFWYMGWQFWTGVVPHWKPNCENGFPHILLTKCTCNSFFFLKRGWERRRRPRLEQFAFLRFPDHVCCCCFTLLSEEQLCKDLPTSRRKALNGLHLFGCLFDSTSSSPFLRKSTHKISTCYSKANLNSFQSVEIIPAGQC